MRTGVRLALDIGSVRVGVARSDASGILALPVETVPRRPGWTDRIAALAGEYEPLEILIGLPVSLDGRGRAAAEAARAAAVEVAERLPGTPIRLVDERFSSVTANARLRESGVPTRKGRSVVDQMAAVIILESALEAERISGVPAGTSLDG